ncbi:VanZ family protein [Streptomyces sp. NPDC005811]|uniref:VanZ family protein n=1 Tax=Streptomyces sp. NPDC005811 TaxID=3154565 RepID=UPI0033E7D634
MIEASISAVPGLIASWAVLAALVAVPTALVAKAKKRPWPLRTALAAYVAGIAAVTLLPGDAGLGPWQCDTGMPLHLVTSASSRLNIALFAPGAFLAVLLFRRPATVAAAFGALSGAVELAQSVGHLGRSCSVTDLAANATGALLGSLAGAVWLYRRRQPPARPVRDLVWGVALAAVAVSAVGGVFQSRIDPVDVVAMDDRRRDLAESAGQAEEWIAAAAKGVFGNDTEVRGTSAEQDGSRLRITAETNHGTLTGTWPAKTLERARSSRLRGDEGSLSEKEVAAAAERFARTWFPRNVVGSEQRIRSTGEGPAAVCTVLYRRYTDGVMMPMRLDLTLTTTGRVIAFSARTVDDPVLPRVTIGEAEAKILAEAATGRSADSTALLAQRVEGEWRPVWRVNDAKAGQHITIDATTGERIADQG